MRQKNSPESILCNSVFLTLSLPQHSQVPVPVGNPLYAGKPHAQPGPGGAPHRASAQESEDYSYTYLPPAQHAYDFGDKVASPKRYDDLAVLTSTGIRASASGR